MSEDDQNSSTSQDVFTDIGQWNTPLTDPDLIFEHVEQWENTGRVSVTGNWEKIDDEPQTSLDDDPGSLRNLLSTLETEHPINYFKRSGGLEKVVDLEKYYEEAQKKWIGSVEFAASDQHRLPYKYYSETVRIRFPKFSSGHKPGDFRRFIDRYVGSDRVVALGMLPLPNEWQMTLKSEEDREGLLRQKKARIGSRNVWITPVSRYEVRGMVHWLPMSVSNAAIASVLGEIATVLFVETLDPKEKVELKHHSKGVRYFSMYLHRDKTAEDVPRVITVEGCKAFVGIPGRAPTCFHCRKEGHRKKDCPIFNVMKAVREAIPKSAVELQEMVEVGFEDFSAPCKYKLEVSGKSDTGTAGQGDSSEVQRSIPVQGDTDIRGQGNTGQRDRGTADHGDKGTTGQGDTDTTVQDSSSTESQIGTSGPGGTGIQGQDHKGTEGQSDTPDQVDRGTQGQGDSGIEGDAKLTQKVEKGALEDYKQVVEGVLVDNLVDSEEFKNIVAEIQELENELQRTLDETIDGLNEKMERGFRIYQNLLALS